MLYIYNIVYNIYMYIYINLCHTKKKWQIILKQINMILNVMWQK